MINRPDCYEEAVRELQEQHDVIVAPSDVEIGRANDGTKI
ncbi:hypothetical protein LEBR102806_11725 [Levilactobacillus brevis]|uniref:Uncharacterized protein n=1 Tax=Levilactobacillus brevis ATCC 14869 = DSM 20054 TaxID=649758 RepID=U2PLF5_LEVBR|nr:hypothetical protein HMPREF0495_00803 [Levilactobacillus brevis ATCC 14869 = DSM 20054]SQG81326.1 Uncharacterised protein [Levilactobacillus brevis]